MKKRLLFIIILCLTISILVVSLFSNTMKFYKLSQSDTSQTKAYEYETVENIKTFEKSAKEFVSNIDAGWNLGNTLEGYFKASSTVFNTAPYKGTGALEKTKTELESKDFYLTNSGIPYFIDGNGNKVEYSDPAEYVKASSWSHEQAPTKELFQKVKSYGYQAIRLPITFFPWMDYSNNDTINPEWLNYIQQMVDWAMECDLYIIIDFHHDDGCWVRIAETGDNWTKIIQRYQRIWEQVANKFKDYDARVLFQGINEPIYWERYNLQNGDWGTFGKFTDEGWQHYNELAQLFVDTVRSTGGNNLERYLVWPLVGAKWDNRNKLVIPTDSTTSSTNRLIIDIHNYPGAVGNYDSSDLSDDRKYRAMFTWINVMNYMNYTFISQDIPVIIGEHNVQTLGKYPDEARNGWSEIAYTVAKYFDTPIFIWDNGGGSNIHNGNAKWQCINRSDYSLYYQEAHDIAMNIVYNSQVKFTEAVAKTDTVGSTNILKGVTWKIGEYNMETGELNTSSTKRAYTEKIHVIGGQTYEFKVGNILDQRFLVCGYDKDGNYVKINNGQQLEPKSGVATLIIPNNVTEISVSLGIKKDVASRMPGGDEVLFALNYGISEPKILMQGEIIPVTGVNLSKETTTVEVGNTETLTVNIVPSNATNKNVTWKSSDTGIITVNNNGIITGIKEGLATITVTTVDGGYSDTITVEVTGGAEAAVTKIEVKQKPSKTIYKKGEALNLAGGIIKVTREDGTTKEISMEESSVVASGYNANKEGTQLITVKYQNQTASFNVIVESNGETKSEVYLNKTAEWTDIEHGIAKIVLEQNGYVQNNPKDIVLVVDMSASMGFVHDYIEGLADNEYLSDKLKNPEISKYKDYKNIEGSTIGFSECLNPEHYNGTKHYYSPNETTESQEEDDYDKQHGCIDRFDVTIEAIQEFMDAFYNANQDNRIAYVAFCNDEAKDYGKYKSNTFITDKVSINNLLKLSQDGIGPYTCYDNGLQGAIDLIKARNLEESGNESINSRETYVLFLSDGKPSTTWNGTLGEDVSRYGEEEAAELNTMATVYAVGIGSAEQQYLNYVASNNEDGNKLINFATSAEELKAVYDEIARKINIVGTDATIEDKISEYFEYYEDNSHKPTATPSLYPSDSTDGKTIQYHEDEIYAASKKYEFYIKVKDEYAPGTMQTNSSAKIKYTSINNERKEVTRESPELSIGKYIMEYYKQNENGTWPTLASEVEKGYGEIGKTITATEKNYTGYTLDKAITGTVTSGILNTDKDVILKLYYTRDRVEVPYTIEYYYDGDKESSENLTGESGTDVSVTQDKINSHLKDGYIYSSTVPTTGSITLSKNAENNIIKVYYTKRTDLSYTVKYLEQGTNKEIASTKIVNNKTYKEIITETAIEIEGYKKEAPTSSTIEIGIGINEITFYYTKINGLSYTVKYIEEKTGKELAIPKIIDGKAYKDKVTERAIQVDGYNVKQPEEKTIEIGMGTNEIIFNYEKRTDIKYKVEYYYDGIKEEEATETKEAEYESIIETYEAKEKEGYEQSNVEGIPLTIVTDESKNIIKVNYAKKEYKITTEEKTEGGKISGSDIKPYEIVKHGDTNTKEIKITPEYGYKVKEVTINGNKIEYVEQDDKTVILEPITNITEDKKIEVEFEKIKAKVIVKYLEKETNEVLIEEQVIEGQVGSSYVTEQKEINNYTIAEVVGTVSGNMTETTITVIYYYSQNATVKIQYRDKNTGEILQEEIKEGKVGDEVEISPLEIAGYTLVERPEEEKVVMEKAEIVKEYKYAKNTKVTVKYLEKGTNEVLAEEVIKTGLAGEEYKTEQKEIENYTIKERIGNEKGIMTNDPITVIYYYLQNAEIEIKHIDKNTGKELATEKIQGQVGSIVELKSKDIEGYVLVEEPEKTEIELTKEKQIVKYYYVHISSGVIEKHIDEITGYIIEEVVHEGNEGDKYETHAKEFNGYELVKSPENGSGTMQKEAIEVKYYYKRKATVRVEIKDKITGEKIAKDIIENGYENDEYKVKIDNIEGYELLEIPDNIEGKMKVTLKEDGTYNTETVVTIYYIHKSGGVEVNYIDKATNQKMDKEEYEGNEGDTYKTKAKEYEGYRLVEESENKEGKMTREKIIVNYYYLKETRVIVKYVNEVTGETIEKIVQDLLEGDIYKIDIKEFEGYDLTSPQESEIKIGKDEKEIVIGYKRTATVTVKYIEETTNKKIIEDKIYNGYEGDNYVTKPQEIDWYDLVTKSENTEGTMKASKDTNNIEVIYTYRKKNFDLKIEKEIMKITVDGKEQKVTNGLQKVDIEENKMAQTEILVTYKIKVINVGEVPGIVREITDYIPEGFEYVKQDSKTSWIIENGKAITKVLQEEIIEPNETKEVIITLKWKNVENNFGEKTNEAKITEYTAKSGFEDMNKDNNNGKAPLLITLKTGKNISRNCFRILGIIIAIVILGKIVTKK